VVHSNVDEVLLSPGVVVSGGSVQRSVLSPGVFVSGADVSGSVLMNDVRVGEGAIVRNAVLDKNVVIPPGARVGFDPEEDAKRGFVVQDGLTVAGKDQPYD
jgi:glucose-1-phosphate adenylyltransferase